MPDSVKKTRIEFIVLTWNSKAYIERCITSVLAIASFDVKLHVIDNGSMDGTVRLLNELEASSGGRMDVVRVGVNLGTTVSRNIAFRALSGDSDYVCVLDSDTVVNDDAFVTMVAALEGDPAIGIVGPTMRTSSGVEQLSGRNLPTITLKLKKAIPFGTISDSASAAEVPSAETRDGLQDVGYLLSACWLMPRRTIDEVGLLDEHIFYAPEDVDYCVRIHKAGYRVVLCKDAEIVHEYQRLSKRKLISKVNLEHAKGLAHYFAKHGYLFDSSKAMQGGVAR